VEENTTEQSCLMRNDSVSQSATNLISRVLINVGANNEVQNPASSSEMTCSICLEEMDEEEGNLFTIPECSHTYHKECIARWKLQSKTCPVCRGLLPEEVGPTLSRLQNVPVEQVIPEMTCCAMLQNMVLIVPGIAYPLFLVLLFVILDSIFLGIAIVLLFLILCIIIITDEDNNIFSAICMEIIMCIVFPFLVCGLVAAFLSQIFYVLYRTLRFYIMVFLCRIRWKDAFRYVIGRTMTLTDYWLGMI